MAMIAAAVGSTSCGGDEIAAQTGGRDVVASFYPLAFAAKEIGGQEVDVANLTPPGAEPHDLEVTPHDVQQIRDADLVLLLGHGFQPQLEDAAGGGDRVVRLLDTPGLRRFPNGDPHVWLDPERYALIAQRIGAALNREDAARRFAARLHELDREYRKGLGACVRHEIVTSHEAFAYLGQRYGLQQIAITGLSPEAEPAPREVEQAIARVRQSGATTVFFETLVSPRIAETVAREAHAGTAVLNPIEGPTPEQEAARRRLLLRHARQPRLARESPRMPLAVELSDLEFGYPGGPRVLRGVDLAIEPGEFVAVAGPNGGGKTTLLRLILGLERPLAGTARRFGEPADRTSRRSGIAYLAQRSQLGIDAPATLREVVAAGRVARRGILRRPSERDRAAVQGAIRRVGLGPRAESRFSTLSGGQQQRALIAKALATEPELLVLDEPTGGVDVDAQEDFASLLAELHDDLAATILFVSHEFGAVERYVDRLVLVRGGIVFDGDPAELSATWHDPSHVHP
jgi:zinc transport system substrate-binding protein